MSLLTKAKSNLRGHRSKPASLWENLIFFIIMIGNKACGRDKKKTYFTLIQKSHLVMAYMMYFDITIIETTHGTQPKKKTK